MFFSEKPSDVIRTAIDAWYGEFLPNLYENWQSRREDLESLIGFSTRFQTMNEFLAQIILMSSESSKKITDSSESVIQMSTIHQAKGLEFDTVFVIGLAEEIFPLKRAIEQDHVDEELRLLYVAITRAKKNLFLLYPQFISSGGPPRLLEISRFLRSIHISTYQTYQIDTQIHF